MGFVVVPVVFGEGVFSRGGGGVGEHGGEAEALHGGWHGRPGQRENGGGDVDGADEALRGRAGFGDAFGPVAVSYTHLDVYKRQTFR